MAVDTNTLLTAAGLMLTVLLAGSAALWKLATSMAEVRTLTSKELTHNGGGSMKDYARDARDASGRAELVAEEARRATAGLRAAVARIEHRLDSAEIRTSGFESATSQRLGDLDHQARNTRLVLELHVKQAAANEVAWRAYELGKGGEPPAPTMSRLQDQPEAFK